jgi:CheY-like chemotaxis protein
MKRKILIVDDDKTIHAILRAILQKDYDVVSAVDGLQGTTLAKQAKPDLIILDLQMPAGGGGSVYERLRMMTDTLTIPILVLTASTLEEAVRRVPGVSPEQILTKPAAPKVLLEAVAKALAA